MTRWVHFTDEPLTAVEAREQKPRPRFKPTGLWVSDEDDYGWKAWAEEEMSERCGEGRLRLAYEVTLAEGANLLSLSTVAALDEFSETYGVDRGGPLRALGGRYIDAVDWQAVAAKYAGILITPYVWECRLSSQTAWYYPWDCASGCIWDPAAIATVQLQDGSALR